MSGRLHDSNLIELIRQTAQEAASEGVKSAFKQYGFDVEHPEIMRRDLDNLRDWSETAKLIRNKGLTTLVGSAILGLLAVLVLGIKAFIASIGH